MKIQILSDQHIEFQKNFSYFKNRCHPRAEILVIAGDFAPNIFPERESFIRDNILTKWKHTIIIPGNHELYGSSWDDEWFGSKEVIYESESHDCKRVKLSRSYKT